jgi:uncharacterized protein
MLRAEQFKAKYGPWAVIAGGSDGTGAAFAEQLARLGLNLLLIARREKPLAELAERLRKTAPIQVQTLSLDLTLPGAAEKILKAAASVEVGLYVSNAGADSSGARFIDQPIQSWRDLIQRNVITLTEAAHGFIQRMLPRKRGGLIFMSSGSALGGQSRAAVYSGTKGFDLNLAESLWIELQPLGIDVLGVAAPTMRTETLLRMARERGMEPGGPGFLEPAEVVTKALGQLQDGPTCMFSFGLEGVSPEEMANIRRKRVVALNAAMKQFFGEGA